MRSRLGCNVRCLFAGSRFCAALWSDLAEVSATDQRCTPLNASASEIDLACHWYMRLDREKRRPGKEEEAGERRGRKRARLPRPGAAPYHLFVRARYSPL